MTDELVTLRSADPLAGRHHALADGPLDDRATSELHALLDGAPPRSRRARWGLVAAGVAAVLGLSVVAGSWLLDGGTAPAYAATPPLLALDEPTDADAAVELQRIAAQAAASAQQPANERRSSWQSWSLATQVADGRATSAVMPEDGEQSWAPDLSCRLVVTAGEPYFPSVEHRRAWEQNAPVAEGDTLHEIVFGPGEYSTAYAAEPPVGVPAMEAYLEAGHHGAPPDPARLVVAVTDLRREWRLGPAQRAAILQVLAQAPGIRELGGTTDRLGRSGEAFAVESDHSGLPTRYVLVVDASSGELLASEQWLTTDAGQLDVQPPAVIAYTAFRD